MKMKKYFKKFYIGIICFSLLFSNMSISIDAAWQAVVAKIFGEMAKEVVTQGAGHAVEKLVDKWFSGEKEYYDAPGDKTTMDYYANNSAVNKATGNISNSGANNENCYNTFSSTVTENRTYSLIKDSYNTETNTYQTMLYNPITNNYTELTETTNIYYNNQYDTYYIENTVNNEYNYYITNNYTYVSYYIINNETDEESYFEIYYELPDGRNSYDLEKEDIWGEYFVYDVVGYESVQEDDGKTLALYHLDGDGKDSSYWKNNDITLASGVFAEGKFGQGLYIAGNNNAYIEADYIDYDNFTLEFTVITNTECNKNSFFYNSFYYRVPALVSPGIYYFVFVVNNGSVSIYCNGQKLDVSVFNKGESTDCILSIQSDKNLYFQTSNSIGVRVPYILDEVRISNCALYNEGVISVPAQPFDTNQVLVLPENPTENMIAVQGKYTVSDFRVGGVRPTYPTKGFVYIYLEDDVVKDIQQYEGDAWCSVNGAIYQDGEWSDLSGCNLSTLRFEEDEPDDSGDDSSNSSDDDFNFDWDNVFGDVTVSGNTVSGNGISSDGINNLINGIGKILSVILSLFGKIMDVVADISQSILDLFSGFTTFTDGFSSFLSATFGFIPSEVLNALKLGISLAVILAIVRFLRGK